MFNLSKTCLLDKEEKRRKRDLVSKNFMDGKWRIFSEETKLWSELKQEKPLLTCLD